MMEEWRIIKDSMLGNRYKVSTNGRVYDILKKRYVSLSKQSGGISVMLSTVDQRYATTKTTRVLVSKLMATAFIAKPDTNGKECVAYHKDGNIYRNVISNIAWGTRDEVKNNTCNLMKEVIAINISNGLMVGRFPSLGEASRRTGVAQTPISTALCNAVNSAGGMQWILASTALRDFTYEELKTTPVYKCKQCGRLHKKEDYPDVKKSASFIKGLVCNECNRMNERYKCLLATFARQEQGARRLTDRIEFNAIVKRYDELNVIDYLNVTVGGKQYVDIITPSKYRAKEMQAMLRD